LIIDYFYDVDYMIFTKSTEGLYFDIYQFLNSKELFFLKWVKHQYV